MDEWLDTTLRHDGSTGQLEQLLVVKESQLDTPWEHSLLTIIPGRRNIEWSWSVDWSFLPGTVAR